jgi:hypothetical protein
MSLLMIPVFAAALLPPTLTKTFTPPTVGTNQLSTLTITMTNPNAVDLTGASLLDNMPAGLFTNMTASTNCPNGSAGASPSFVIGGGTIPANGSCTLTTMVFSPMPGSYQNLTNTLFSSGPPSAGGASATINVLATIPAMSWPALALLAVALAAIGSRLTS